MPATIINVQAVEESITKAEERIALQEEALNDIDRIINSMEASWESESQRAYADSFRVSKQRIETFNESLRGELQKMQGFLDETLTADELTARELRSISW